MDGELVRLTGTEWAVLDCLWEASPQTMTQLAHTLAGREGWALSLIHISEPTRRS
mgnify:CR=1 FL=1